jgi:hypothetical protein
LLSNSTISSKIILLTLFKLILDKASFKSFSQENFFSFGKGDEEFCHLLEVSEKSSHFFDNFIIKSFQYKLLKLCSNISFNFKTKYLGIFKKSMFVNLSEVIFFHTDFHQYSS